MSRKKKLKFNSKLIKYFSITLLIVLVGIFIYPLIKSLLFRSASINEINATGGLDLYVSPTGKDSNDGNLVSPLKTLEGARNKIRQLGLAGKVPIMVFLKGGTYPISSSVVFESQDSGTAENPITYTRYIQETPIISGGIPIINWKNVNGRWEATIPNNIAIPRQLWVGGTRATRARSEGEVGWSKNSSGYQGNNLTFSHPEDLEVVSRVLWKEFRCGVGSISGSNVIMENPCWTYANLHQGFVIYTPTWIENSIELLDKPGEWYIDPRTRKITYFPKPDEKIGEAEIILPVAEKIIAFKGVPNKSVQNIYMVGLRFYHNTWNLPSTPSGLSEIQANTISNKPSFDTTNYSYPTAAISMEYAKHISIVSSHLSNLGGSGIEINRGSSEINISSNFFTDISSTSIYIGPNLKPNPPAIDEISGVTISRNRIENVGNEYHGAPGITGFYTKNTSIVSNTISNVPYSGISLGWGWGRPDPSNSSSNLIRSNLITNTMQELNDGGSIYLLGAQPGTLVKNNALQNQRIGPSLYLDNASRFITVRENVMIGNPTSVFAVGGSNTYEDNYWQNRGNVYTDWLGINVPDVDIRDNVTCHEKGIATPCGNSTQTNNHSITQLSDAPKNIMDSAGITGKPIRPVKNDFNGDGKSDAFSYDSQTGTWNITNRFAQRYGTFGDTIIPGDYDGDGITNMATYRPSDHTWYLRGIGPIQFGSGDSTPVPGDYNGDGKTDLAMFTPSTGTWDIKDQGQFIYGQAGDIPTVADYNGDGKEEIAVFRPSDSTWYIRGLGKFVYGESTDIPVPADYTGDGKANIATFRPSDSTWYIRGLGKFVYGASTDVPVPGDYNGDGKTDIATYRPTEKKVYIRGLIN